MSRISFKNIILSNILKKRINHINRISENPIETQKKTLKYLINTSKNTEFGIEHSFNRISNYETFINYIPIRDYEELFKYIKRIREGGGDILWPGEIRNFAKSSGTTNAKSKFIPLSKETLYNCHYKGGKDMLALYLNSNPNSKMFDGKGIILGGYQENNNKYIDADLSAILLKNFPFWVNMHRIPDIKTAVMKDWNKKLEEITNQSINQNVTNLSGVPSWMLLLLQNIVLTTGANNISEIWPNLELYMHGGINFSPYQNQFNKLIPSIKMNYLETYNASEGFFALQDINGCLDLLLMLDYGIFYEFIPMSDYNGENSVAIPLSEVKKGENYAVVISTNGGLWRYLIGDTVKFTSLAPYRIRITGRTKHHINVFGEELIIENAEEALKLACKKTKATITDYTVGPIFMDGKKQGSHEWIIEFAKAPKSLEYFTELLDNALKSINSDYEAKRYNNMTLVMPKIHSVKKGLFYSWLKKKGKLGGQHKVPRLSNKRDFVEELLGL